MDWTQLSQLDIPILGICYGLQEIAWHHDNKNVLAGEKREYGHAKLKIEKHKGEAAHVDKLFNGLGNTTWTYGCLMVRSIPGKVERYPLKMSGDKLSHSCFFFHHRRYS